MDHFANLFGGPETWEAGCLAEQLIAARESRPASDYPFLSPEDPLALAQGIGLGEDGELGGPGADEAVAEALEEPPDFDEEG